MAAKPFAMPKGPPLDPSEERVVAYLIACAKDWDGGGETTGPWEARNRRIIAQTYRKAALHIREGRHRPVDP